jgi:hypothetical protein
VEQDDLSIVDSWRLLRRIPLIVGGIHPQIVLNENTNRYEPSSLAFNHHPDDPRAFSVHIEPVLIANGLTIQDVLIDASKFAVVGFTAGQVRACQQVINRKPLPGEPAHAHVIGGKKNSIRGKLKKCAVWVIPPPANLLTS